MRKKKHTTKQATKLQLIFTSRVVYNFITLGKKNLFEFNQICLKWKEIYELILLQIKKIIYIKI